MDSVEPGVGGVPNRFLGITPAYLWQTQHQHMTLYVDMTEYRMSLSREVEAHFKLKCDRSCNAFVLDDNDSSSSGVQSSRSWLIERVKLLIEENERAH
ncbi:AUGMIN subunit 4-like isoform X1 [Arachis hypogaea]|uniref:AUGMIN subunit 4-like isoform X1 n=2 Tax=Arachis hypogaea TaxID=3818 RepID=UPI0007869539